jgi:hypothetical protein
MRVEHGSSQPTQGWPSFVVAFLVLLMTLLLALMASG